MKNTIKQTYEDSSVIGSTTVQVEIFLFGFGVNRLRMRGRKPGLLYFHIRVRKTIRG